MQSDLGLCFFLPYLPETFKITVLQNHYYRKVPKFSNARKLCCNLPKIQEKRPNLRVFHQRDANGIAMSSENTDQTAPGSALFAKTYLSENIG